MCGGKCLTWKRGLSPVDTDAKSVSYTFTKTPVLPRPDRTCKEHVSVAQTARSMGVTLDDLLAIAANIAVTTHSCRVTTRNVRTIRQQATQTLLVLSRARLL